MLTLKEIRSALADRRLDVVAEATGLHPNSIARIRDGKNENPRHETVDALSRYLTQTVRPAQGCYMAEIIGAEVVRPADDAADLVVTYRLLDSSSVRSAVYPVRSSDPRKEDGGRTALAELCRAIGIARVYDVEELVGKRLRICFSEEIVHKKVENG
jgi:hypothetical protein